LTNRDRNQKTRLKIAIAPAITARITRPKKKAAAMQITATMPAMIRLNGLAGDWLM